MALIGMLHYRKDPNRVKKAYAFAAVAKAEGIDFYYFTPENVDFDTLSIKSKVLENGQWKDKVLPFPDVIYNAGASSTPQSKIIIKKLKKIIPFTSRSVGSKLRVYKKLLFGKKYVDFLIPHKVISHKKVIYDFLDKHQKIILKPIRGRQGKGIYYVEKKGEKYLLIDKAVSKLLSTSQFNNFIHRSIPICKFQVQKYVHCKNKAGNSFDFRIHIQKNGQGHWVVTSIYGRIGAHKSIVANLSNGGSCVYAKPLLQQEFPANYEKILMKLETLGVELGAHMDELYGRPFDELGIDVGIDDDANMWIFEVNWRPGTPPIFYLEMDVVLNTLHYAVYLANLSKEKNMNN